MRLENQQMKAFLKANGIDAVPQYIKDGSVKGSWRLYGLVGKNPDGSPIWVKWWDNFELQDKLNGLGFTDLWGNPLSNSTGNGGDFSIFVRGHNELLEPVVIKAKVEAVEYTTRATRRCIRSARADRANARITKRNGRSMYY